MNSKFGYIHTIERYDSANDAWSFGAGGNSSAFMTSKRYGAAAASYQSGIYAFGGVNSEGYLKSVERYNTSTSKWTFVTNMSSTRFAATATVLGDYIYVIGGMTSTNGAKCPCPYLGTVERYNPVKNQWSTVATMSVARFAGTAMVG